MFTSGAGFPVKETIAAGLRRGGQSVTLRPFTMPNTEPPIDCAAVSDLIRARAAAAGLARVYPIGALTRGRRGAAAADFDSMLAAGVRAFSDDGAPVADSRLFLAILKKLAGHKEALVISHSEDLSLAAGGRSMKDGVATWRALSWKPKPWP